MNGRRRPTPDELLRQVEEAEARNRRGVLKVFLGYASGVGKSYRMLDEGRRRKQRGEDVVIGAWQNPDSEAVGELLRRHEVISPQIIDGRPVVDVPAILARRPQVCLIDALAHDNPPGARNVHRWQDIDELRNHGISILTAVNIHYIDRGQDRHSETDHDPARATVPEAFVRGADEIEVVDAPPEYCIDRTPQNGEAAVDHDRERRLLERREAALLLAADVVDQQLEEYLARHGIDHHYGAMERILVCVTARSNAGVMVRRGRRQADRFHGELFVVFVDSGRATERDRSLIDAHLSMARALGANVAILHGRDPVPAILSYAREHGITQIFVGHSQRRNFLLQFRPNPLERLILGADGLDIRIFPNASPQV